MNLRNPLTKHARKGSTLSLKSKKEVTSSPKQGYQIKITREKKCSDYSYMVFGEETFPQRLYYMFCECSIRILRGTNEVYYHSCGGSYRKSQRLEQLGWNWDTFLHESSLTISKLQFFDNRLNIVFHELLAQNKYIFVLRYISVVDREFPFPTPEGVSQPIMWPKFCWKLHENENIWTKGASLTPPTDPPLQIYKRTQVIYWMEMTKQLNVLFQFTG